MRMLSELSCSGASLPSFSHRNSWGLRGGMGSGTAGSPPNCIVGGGGEGLPPPEAVIEVPPNPNPFHLSVIPLFGAPGGGNCPLWDEGHCRCEPTSQLRAETPPFPRPRKG